MNTEPKAATITITVELLEPVPTGRMTPENQMEWEEQEIPKQVTFRKLNRRDSSQRALQACIMNAMQTFKITKETENIRLSINPDDMAELSTRLVETLVVVDNGFTEKDKEALLSDNIAIINVGYDLFGREVLPFFLRTKPISEPPPKTTNEPDPPLLNEIIGNGATEFSDSPEDSQPKSSKRLRSRTK